MAKEVIDGQRVDKKLKSRNPTIKFDKLKMYFREPYEIDLPNSGGKIVLVQPSIGDVVDLGEKRFYATLNIFTTNTTAFRLQLWNEGIDWNVLPDFELFIMLLNTAEKEIYQTFLPTIDFGNMGRFVKETEDGNKQKILYDMTNNIEINEQTYFVISQYLRNTFNIFPDEKMTDDEILKQWYIEKDKRELKNRGSKEDSDEDTGLLPVISGCINHPGFKYKTSELKQLGVYQFFDSVKRLQVYESTTALNHGAYSGFCDTKGIPQESFNFMRSI